MPDSGSQIILCNLPIRYDTYSGCSHGCVYCYAVKNGQKVQKKEGPAKLENWINGKRSKRTSWCDWDIPLHFGGMSDPFQPIEKKYRSTMKSLEVFASKKYPFVFSSKGAFCGDKDYLSVLKKCNVVGQISCVSPKYDKHENGAPGYFDRLLIIKKLSSVCERVIVRVQPYTLSSHNYLIKEGLEKFKEAGAYGITIEGLKGSKKKDGFVKIGKDFCYPTVILRNKFSEIKRICHGLGLAFYCAENRLRSMGDSLTCCGCDNVQGFKVNKANLNSFFFDKTALKFTDKMKEKGTGGCFAPIIQKWDVGRMVFEASYQDLMIKASKTKTYRVVMGVE